MILDYQTQPPARPLPKWLSRIGLYAISFGLAGLIYREAEALPRVTIDDDPREYIWGIPVEYPPGEMYNPAEVNAERFDVSEAGGLRKKTRFESMM